jgi:outer membrane protein assembly factor BamB
MNKNTSFTSLFVLGLLLSAFFFGLVKYNYNKDYLGITINNALEASAFKFNSYLFNNVDLLATVISARTHKDGLLMFRGSPSRDYYGFGILPTDLEIKWKYPKERMCSYSSSGGKISEWCGSGWTGQPVVWERSDGKTEVIFGAYDGAVHFVDTDTGHDLRPPFQTDDIIKGSVTLDPDGFPLLYFGSRDNKLRILALEDDTRKELWSLDANKLGGMWNNDWDANPVVMNDILYEGCENGKFYAIKLNRTIDKKGKVKVYPKIIFTKESYNDELVSELGRNMSIENSPVFYKDRVYFANSGGRVLGLDISDIEHGVAPTVFDYWVGDDVDATIVVDDDGMLYVSAELERFTARSEELGQFIKLDPYTKHDPYVWGIPVPKERGLAKGGIWATPAIYGDYLYVPTHTGRLMVVRRSDGMKVWEDEIAKHSWSSPVIVDNKLLVATCGSGMNIYSLENPSKPVLLENYQPTYACIESTPAVWDGEIFVGARDGFFYAIGEKELKDLTYKK